MPGADMKTVRSAFFRPVKARETNKDGNYPGTPLLTARG